MSIEFLLGVWFFLWALLWAVYFILDGFDLGAATLMPFIAKNDDEIRTVYNASFADAFVCVDFPCCGI